MYGSAGVSDVVAIMANVAVTGKSWKGGREGGVCVGGGKGRTELRTEPELHKAHVR